MQLPRLKNLGLVEYLPTWQAMQNWASADPQSNQPDEIWALQHPPVFTMGQNASPAHLLNPGDIPVVNIDRGGQVTYHGPGQLVVYPLLSLERYGIGVRSLVTLIENSLIQCLADFDIDASAKADAPGVYVNERKIASIGLRVKKGRCYHGLALNVDMDLEPFQRINPCGYSQLKMTQMSQECASKPSFSNVQTSLLKHLQSQLKQRCQ